MLSYSLHCCYHAAYRKSSTRSISGSSSYYNSRCLNFYTNKFFGYGSFALYYVAINDLHDVSKALDGFHKSQWKVLGRQLGLKSDLLDQINADYQQNGVEDCSSRVLEAWLKRNYDEASFGPPKWQSLADAVKRSGDPALGATIWAQH